MVNKDLQNEQELMSGGVVVRVLLMSRWLRSVVRVYHTTSNRKLTDSENWWPLEIRNKYGVPCGIRSVLYDFLVTRSNEHSGTGSRSRKCAVVQDIAGGGEGRRRGSWFYGLMLVMGKRNARTCICVCMACLCWRQCMQWRIGHFFDHTVWRFVVSWAPAGRARGHLSPPPLPPEILRLDSLQLHFGSHKKNRNRCHQLRFTGAKYAYMRPTGNYLQHFPRLSNWI